MLSRYICQAITKPLLTAIRIVRSNNTIDAVQETFLKAYRSLDSFQGACSEKTWLTRIAVNVCRNLLRAGWFRHVDRRVTLDELPEPIAPFTELDDTVFRTISELPRTQREVVLLYFYQDMTMRERLLKRCGLRHRMSRGDLPRPRNRCAGS